MQGAREGSLQTEIADSASTGRPLLPAPSAKHPQPDPKLALSRYQLVGRRKAVDSACDSCRSKKSKCDGRRPLCMPCSSRGLACHYSDDQSRFSKHKLKEAQHRLSVYDELFRVIRTKQDQEAVEIMARIRNGDSAEAILRHVQDGDLLLQLHVAPETHYQYSFPYRQSMPKYLLHDDNPYLASFLFKCSSFGTTSAGQQDVLNDSTRDHGPYHIPLHAAEIVDPRLEIVHAKTWTSVIDDDALFSKLLQVFFLSEHTWHPTLDKDHFLDDMVASRKRFCSSLLVNSILASACHGYSKLAARAEFWNPRMLGYQFFAEARRLWELEIGKPKVTTIQAAIVLSVVYDAIGSDKIGSSYLEQAVRAGRQIQLFAHSKPNEDLHERHVRAVTAWGLFGLQATHCFHVFLPPLVDRPPDVPLPEMSSDQIWQGEIWLRYPLTEKLFPVYYKATYMALTKLRVIIHDLASELFGKASSSQRHMNRTIQGFWTRATDWYRQLPAELDPKVISFPWQLKLHMYYYNLVIFLLETSKVSLGSLTSGTDAGRMQHDAEIRFETLLRLYYLRHGFESYDIFMIYYLSFLGFMFLKDLDARNSSDYEERLSTILLTAKGLLQQSKNCYLAAVVYRVLKGRMNARMKQLLNDFGEHDSKDEEQKIRMTEHLQSAWPIDVVGIVDDPDSLRLDRLSML